METALKKSRFTESQIGAVLKKVKKVCRWRNCVASMVSVRPRTTPGASISGGEKSQGYSACESWKHETPDGSECMRVWPSKTPPLKSAEQKILTPPAEREEVGGAIGPSQVVDYTCLSDRRPIAGDVLTSGQF